MHIACRVCNLHWILMELKNYSNMYYGVEANNRVHCHFYTRFGFFSRSYYRHVKRAFIDFGKTLSHTYREGRTMRAHSHGSRNNDQSATPHLQSVICITTHSKVTLDIQYMFRIEKCYIFHYIASVGYVKCITLTGLAERDVKITPEVFGKLTSSGVGTAMPQRCSHLAH